MVNGTLLNFGKRYDNYFKGHFWSVAKVALRFGCANQSKNLERYLISLGFDNYFDPMVMTGVLQRLCGRK